MCSIYDVVELFKRLTSTVCYLFNAVNRKDLMYLEGYCKENNKFKAERRPCWKPYGPNMDPWLIPCDR
jgi:hypothetical protein